ncbi:DUF4936 family protein [Lacisediminimonas sp.]|uniref:DUF4936 family protein n=1 Tax=Lacisediminimonas sp. TaxID=3060582 RepID=UPI00271E6DC3|nr:DUF4936 family protein [Lacisediminimonas sp.]MDO8299962.1 DUF4936 family protein [Lacisediminimonas sp.]MDO9219252.1 DUF4936 family protein [Lacisediminimonas sp.]
MDLYVYYRVRSDAAAALHPKVVAMQARLAEKFKLAVSLKRRPGESKGEQTWMEVYPGTPEGFAQALQEAVDADGLAEHMSGGRHTEVFTDISACA